MKKGQCFRADKLLEEFIEKKLSNKKAKISEEETDKLIRLSAKADGLTKEEID